MECSNLLAIDGPYQSLRAPVKCISVIFISRVADIRLCSSIVIASDTFAKDIGLDFAASLGSEVASTPFPVDFIQAVGHEDSTCDHTSTICCFSDDLDFAEEEIEAGPDIRRVETLSKCEFGTVRAILDNGLVCECPTLGLFGLFREIN